MSVDRHELFKFLSSDVFDVEAIGEVVGAREEDEVLSTE
jgi:hypothetical protein